MNTRDPDEFELSLFGMKIRAKGLMPVIVALVIALAVIWRVELPDLPEWIRMASR